MQHDAVGAGDAAARVATRRLFEVVVRDAQVVQHLTRLLLLVPQRCPALHAGVHLELLQGLGEVDALQPVRLARLVQREAVGGHRLQDVADQELAAVGHVGRDGVGAVQDALFQLAHRLGPEGHNAGDHEIKQYAQRPNVHVATEVALVFKELGRGVGGRPAESVQGLVAPTEGTEAEVTHFDSLLGSEEHVFRFDIAVYDIVFMLEKGEHN